MPNYTLKCNVTQDGNGFDKPATVSIRKRPNVPSKATLTFPNLNGKFSNYFSSTDIIAVYLGLDVVEPKAIIMGFPVELTGRSVLTVGLTDMLAIVNRDHDRLWKYDNYDGWEAGHAMRNAVDAVDQSMYSQTIDTTGIQGTNPRVILDDTLRYESYGTVLSIVKDIQSRSWDDSGYPSTPLPYTAWMLENRLNFRKMERIDEADAVLNFANVDDLLSSHPSKSIMPLINKVTCIGAGYTDMRTGDKKVYVGSYTHQSSVNAFGLHHKVIKDESLTNIWQCEQRAAREVMASKVRSVTSTISVPNLLSAIPDVTAINVNDSKYGVSGNHRISELAINYGGGNSRCSATLNNTEPVLTEFL
jgi:hypothetical protein